MELKIGTGVEKNNYIRKVILCAAIFTITYLIVFHQTQYSSDYYVHMNLALNLYAGNILDDAYPMWHVGVKVLYKILNPILGMPIGYVTAIFTALINVIIYWLVDFYMSNNQIKKHELAAFLVLLVQPIYAPWFNSFLYVGQGSPNTWHNPTNLMVKPFAFVAFFIVCSMIEKSKNGQKVKWSVYIFLGILLLLSLLAKPSFLQGFLPGLGLFLLLRCIKEKFKYMKHYLLICVSFAPTVMVMGYQILLSFYTPGGKNGEGMGIGWMEVMGHSTKNVYFSLLLVLAFPFIYMILNARKVFTRIDMQLALSFGCVAWLEYALLYENGPRKYHGNFGWSVQIAYTLIWIISTMLYAKDLQNMDMNDKKTVRKNTILAVIYFAHLFSGVYYIIQMATVADIIC